MNMLEFLWGLRPAIPMSMERPGTPMSKAELRRCIDQCGVLVNTERCNSTEPVDFPVFSIVLFPKSNRKTTIV